MAVKGPVVLLCDLAQLILRRDLTEWVLADPQQMACGSCSCSPELFLQPVQGAWMPRWPALWVVPVRLSRGQPNPWASERMRLRKPPGLWFSAMQHNLAWVLRSVGSQCLCHLTCRLVQADRPQLGCLLLTSQLAEAWGGKEAA